MGSRPLLSRSGCIYTINRNNPYAYRFSSPFIEERLYLHYIIIQSQKNISSRPLLSRSGCISMTEEEMKQNIFGSRPLLSRSGCIYNFSVQPSNEYLCSRPLLSRSGCIYKERGNYYDKRKKFSSPFIEERLYLKSWICIEWCTTYCSRPLLSRSGCIFR